jgi:cyclic beta-1,2-glucan synthetase
MNKPHLVAGYFSSRESAKRALRLLSLTSFSYRLRSFSSIKPIDHMDAMAVAWLQPGEWLLTASRPEAEAKQINEIMIRSGETMGSIVLSPELLWNAPVPVGLPLRRRWARHLAVIQDTLARQVEQASAGDLITGPAKWGVAEAAYEDSLAGISLIEHRYIIDGYIERLKVVFKRSINNLPSEKVNDLKAPIVYFLAREAIDKLKGDTTEQRLTRWLRRRCRDLDLTEVELQTLEAMVIVALMEDLSEQVSEDRRREAELKVARFSAARISSLPPEELKRFAVHLASVLPDATASFVVIAAELLRDQPQYQPEIASALGIARTRPHNLDAAMRRLQHRDAIRLERFNSTVTSLRAVARASWEDVVEEISPIVHLFRQDPARVFSEMDAPTRLLYRKCTEEMSRWSKVSERRIAEAVMRSAVAGTGVANHIGYHLVDDGRLPFEKLLGIRRPFVPWLERGLAKHSGAALIIGVLGLTLAATSGVVILSGPISWQVGATLVPVVFTVVSQPAVELYAYLISRIMRPRGLPKMLFKNRIPDNYDTLIVVPTLLRDANSTKAELERLEIRYLANPDKGLSFGLITDLVDSTERETPHDLENILTAESGIRDLARRHPEGRFFLYHRPSVFSQVEGVWMGRERKRGKLEELNAVIAGELAADNLLVGEKSWLTSARFVITLDADTELPLGTARRLIEVMAHPLNAPQLGKFGGGYRLLRGFGIVQPLISTNFESGHASRIARFLNGRLGVDPYMVGYSDMYFDLAGDGVFHGKGIYDAKVFHAVLGGRLPENRVLSHDLLEGSYLKVALAQGIQLFDAFPRTGKSLLARQHRWVRGDWQIARWIGGLVPTSIGLEPTPLSIINRWKLADNLRRSLVPVAATFLILVAYLMPETAQTATLAVGTLVLMPLVLRLIDVIIVTFRRGSPDLTGLIRGMAETAYQLGMLPRNAWLVVDAVVRVLYRLTISHHHLLQWVTADDTQRLSGRSIGIIDIIIMVLSFGAANTTGNPLLILLFSLWTVMPLVGLWLDQPDFTAPVESLDAEERLELRRIALQTWRYFDEYMTAEHNFLPPDNMQVALKTEIAIRTSPTNIGLGLLSWIAARDLGYITADQLCQRTEDTLETLGKLETYKGHLYNWYQTDTLDAMLPRYVSMVDSGNLMASLWTFRQGILEEIERPIICEDTVGAWREMIDEVLKRNMSLPASIRDELTELARRTALDHGYVSDVRELAVVIIARHEEIELATHRQHSFIVQRLLVQAEAWVGAIDTYMGWYLHLSAVPAQISTLMSTEMKHYVATVLQAPVSLASLNHSPQLEGYSMEAVQVRTWWQGILAEHRQANEAAGQSVKRLLELAEHARYFGDRTDMAFLYHRKRRAFHIGYNVDEEKLDLSYYDLLASEARLGSFTAIAAGQVPVEHWWALGRNSRLVDGQPVLLSWSGTMFEYMMPRLVMREYPDTLLHQAYRSAIAVQRQYGERLDIPWGISESAHSALDYDNTYQYRAFGVPALGVQSGLEQGVVIAPYASLLALSIAPKAAVANLRQLSRLGFRGDMGYFEAIDYRRPATATGERGVGVFTYMAHHQGMGLISIANLLTGDRFSTRFHSDLRVRAAETILQERITKPKKSRQDSSLKRIKPLLPLEAVPIVTSTSAISTALPMIHTLTNGRYQVAVSSSGDGYSRWGNIQVNRWIADPHQPEQGSFIYLRDTSSQQVWSTTYAPTYLDDDTYNVSFMPEKIVFDRNYLGISTRQQIFVVPDHDVEVRMLHVCNTGKSDRRLEVTSALELGLAPREVQNTHPAFNRLFIDVEAMTQQDGVLAHRRMRSSDEAPVWAAHLVVNLSHPASRATLQTDRETFLGRLGSMAHPQGLGHYTPPPEYTLDAMAAITQAVSLKAGEAVELAAITILGSSRDEVLRLVGRYRQESALKRARQAAWTIRQAELRRLQITDAESRVLAALTPYLVYPNYYLKHAARGLVPGGNLPAIEMYDIPGGLCVVAALDDAGDLRLANQLGLAQKYFAVRGISFTLLLLVKISGEAGIVLTRRLQELAESMGSSLTDQNIKVMQLSCMSENILSEITRRSRIVIDGADGALWQQLSQVAPLALGLEHPAFRPAQAALPAYAQSLEYDNGYGGFSENGRTYRVTSDATHVTPAPWANVMANEVFGTLVTERGGGFTWAKNSQNFRLTPWQNEPLIDTPGEMLYVHDIDSDHIWSPQAGFSPQGSTVASYRAGISRYEGSYDGMEYSLEIFVPVGQSRPLPVKIQRLMLRNTTGRNIQLRLTNLVTLVMGGNREDTQDQVITSWNDRDEIILAINPSHADYPTIYAFAAQSSEVVDYTSDRSEFMGPLHEGLWPQGLGADKLSGRVGPGLDPVAVTRSVVEVGAGQQYEANYFLGTVDASDQASALVRRLRTEGYVDELRRETVGWWDKTLGAIQVKTPFRDTDIMLNYWLLYQVLSSRIWGRTGYYQSSGAFGFRDQLQDSLALVYARPEITRGLILEAARHQFKEGDVHHWWQPMSLHGLRSRMTDDRLWLPYVTLQYIRVTGDEAIMRELVPFMEASPIAPGSTEVYDVAQEAPRPATLLEHCLQAVEVSLVFGSHGLPLIGTGDWNDGYNRVGIGGKGESIWLGWFMVVIFDEFATWLGAQGDQGRTAARYRKQSSTLVSNLEAHGWDGRWYRRAYFDDGTPLGSVRNSEGSVDLLPQSWAVLSGRGDPQRGRKAMDSVLQKLVDKQSGIIKLLTPSYDVSHHDPGYIKGYLPGVRENGGQYTHAALWAPLALLRQDRPDEAVALLRMLNPINHSLNIDEANKYVLEPYVTSGDVYSLPGHAGRGGWSWYSGSAAWMYRIWIEETLGFVLRGNQLTIKPCLPQDWPGFEIAYRFGASTYEISVSKKDSMSNTNRRQVLDGQPIPLGPISLIDDRQPHQLEITLSD